MTDGYGKENSAVYWKARHGLLEQKIKRKSEVINNLIHALNYMIIEQERERFGDEMDDIRVARMAIEDAEKDDIKEISQTEAVSLIELKHAFKSKDWPFPTDLYGHIQFGWSKCADYIFDNYYMKRKENR